MDETAPDPIQTPGRDGSALVPGLTIAFHPEPSQIGARCVVGDRLEIGRGGAGLGPGLLDDDLLSRRHAELVRDGVVTRVRDLGSRNGTFVNGRRVETAELWAGDVLGVGSLLMVFGWGPKSYPAPRDPRLGGVSAALAHVVDEIATVAPQDITVLVRGETGVGKELVARRLHELSGRGGDFVAVNCGGIPDGVLASELFGHVAGAFSGAVGPRVGLVEAAAGGTLFLDEIGDASPQLQVSILRLLQDREYRPVGSSQARQSDARFVAATHVRLDAAVAEGRFRDDLLARLRRWVVDVPPLRERREDIIPLALDFARDRAGATARIDRPLALALLLHDWPDNVRGLRAILDTAAIEAEGSLLTLSARVTQQLAYRMPPPEPPAVEAVRYRKERPGGDYLVKRLAEVGNVKALAHELGVARNTLYRWFRDEGIDPKSILS